MEINLPPVSIKGEMSVEEAIKRRRSIRHFKKDALKLPYLSQLLWASQGILEGWRRTSPSAGATYPLELYVVVGEVIGIEHGVYHYINESHALRLHLKGDIRKELTRAALGQGFITDAPLSIVIAGDFSRTTTRYGDRGRMYVHIEVGHVGENLYLQATSLGLGTVAVGAFRDNEVKKVLSLPKGFEPLYIMPFGYPIYRKD